MSNNNYSEWSKEQLVEEIKTLKFRKKYGLVWEEKEENLVSKCQKELPVLDEVKTNSVLTDDVSPTNLIIEGDNYHALSVLNYTHQGKVNLIYIDPPYNTGAKDWKYNNDYIDKNDRWRHSKFVTMMSTRLKIAKNLLKQDGVIMVAIDDHEIHNIRHLMDIYFGEENYISTFCIEVNPAGQNIRQNAPAISHDYCLIYAKDIESVKLITRELSEAEIKAYKHEDENGRYLWDNLRRRGGNSTPQDRPGQWYPLYVNYETGEISLQHFNKSTEVWPIDPKGIKRIWRVNPDGFVREYAKGNIAIVKKTKKYEISKKSYEPQGKKPKTLWKDARHSATTHGTKLLLEILGTNSFTYPKSVHLVEDCIKYYANSNAVILDFFAGSGTTGQAVMNLNKKDGGRRQFILCTNNEVGYKSEQEFCKENKISRSELSEWINSNNEKWLKWTEKYGICSSVTFPRMKNVIKGYKFSGGKKDLLFQRQISIKLLQDADLVLEEIDNIKNVNNSLFDKYETIVNDTAIQIWGVKQVNGFVDGLGGNLRYFKTSFVPKTSVSDDTRKSIVRKSVEMICVRENTFDKVTDKIGYKVYRNNETATGILLDLDEIEAFKEELNTLKISAQIYVFSLTNDTYASDFEDLAVEHELCPIPESILEVYRKLFRQ